MLSMRERVNEKLKMLQPSVAVALVAHHSVLAHCDQEQSPS